MIVSFRDADTAAVASGRRISRFVNIEAVARRKLRQLDIAGRLEDLRVPPGNRLEALTRDRACRFFGLSNGYWLRAQVAYDTEVVAKTLAPVLRRIKPWVSTAA